MTDRVALFLGLAILAFLVLDLGVMGWGFSAFLARRFADLVQWVAFWR
ncbi:hypothetical protein [Ruixingdingia sedimenti]|uniref:Glyceraldehyde-3-phosphate dehydrogenase n=1 Tax=Ruixingdingia sedimenti TaxID=3073604 RepID=A0ABU1F386_9RHOB|nr:hypothetical protein [Xinfangfangia sp. LG-4]MDR5651331.1 hypothetical protein [Xinfangfangia sp. LG-4]